MTPEKFSFLYFFFQVPNTIAVNALGLIDKLCNKNLNECWKYWKRLNPAKTTSYKIDIDDFTKFYENSNSTCRSQYVDTSFMDKIEKVMISINSSSFQTPELYDDILNGPISPTEISLALKKAKNNKAGGGDGFSVEFFKYSNGALENTLCALFNYIFDTGDYFVEWATGQIAPIHKKSARSDPTKYRKITLLPALGKIFESVLNNRLRYCRKINIDEDPFQNGFKEGARATDNIFILNGVI